MSKPRSLFFASAALILSLNVLLARRTAADTFTSFRFERREELDPDRDTLEDGINKAECEADAVLIFFFQYTGALSAEMEVWTGASCDVKENRDEGRCFRAVGPEPVGDVSGLIEIKPAWIVDPQSDPPRCTEAKGVNNVYLWLVDDTADRNPRGRIWSITVPYDTTPPPPPINVTAGYGENKATVGWEPPTDKPEDWNNFAVLCYPPPQRLAADTPYDMTNEGRGTGGADRDDAGAPPADLPPREVEGGEWEICPPGGFNEGDDLGSEFLCSGLLGSSSRSYMVENLQNGQPYKFAVVAYDNFKNPSKVSKIVCGTPNEVGDFWEHYKRKGGRAEGEFCFIATAAYGSPLHPCVVELRAFRDEVLSLTPVGRAVTHIYYRFSPAAAKVIEEQPVLRAVVAASLLPATSVAWVSVRIVRTPLLAVLFLLPPLVVLLLWRRVGRRTRRGTGLLAASAATALLVMVFCPTEAGALSLKREQKGSPQRFAAELKFGPYYPSVDDEFSEGGGTPFRDIFGSSSVLLGLVGLDYQFFRPPGFSLGIGASIGGFRFKGKALDLSTQAPSDEEVTFTAMPMHLNLVLRVDALIEYTVIPLVPYIKSGISYYLWWTKDADGVSEFGGKKGRGGTFGWNLQTGLMFCLDPLEPYAARTFDNELGVNNSYIFAEFFLARIDNFGSREALNLSDRTFTIGLAIEF